VKRYVSVRCVRDWKMHKERQENNASVRNADHECMKARGWSGRGSARMVIWIRIVDVIGVGKTRLNEVKVFPVLVAEMVIQ